VRSPHKPVSESMDRENRFKMLTKTKPEEAKRLSQEAQKDVDVRWQMYQYLAAFKKE
jgi:pyruvate-ferredoxin/flavodoxin oxidoreductase